MATTDQGSVKREEFQDMEYFDSEYKQRMEELGKELEALKETVKIKKQEYIEARAAYLAKERIRLGILLEYLKSRTKWELERQDKLNEIKLYLYRDEV